MKYYIPSLGETEADAREMEASTPSAEEVAQEEFIKRNGELRYPVVVVLIEDDGNTSRWRVEPEGTSRLRGDTARKPYGPYELFRSRPRRMEQPRCGFRRQRESRYFHSEAGKQRIFPAGRAKIPRNPYVKG